MDQPEVVPPSAEPDAAVTTGTGGQDAGATPPPPPDQSAGTGGLGTQSEQRGAGAPPADAPYDLTPEARDESQSDSGT